MLLKVSILICSGTVYYIVGHAFSLVLLESLLFQRGRLYITN